MDLSNKMLKNIVNTILNVSRGELSYEKKGVNH